MNPILLPGHEPATPYAMLPSHWVRMCMTCIAFVAGCMALHANAAHVGMMLETNKGPMRIYEESRALVIGNSAYTEWNELPTIPTEMSMIRQELEHQGFDVEVKMNATAEEMPKILKKFLYADTSLDSRLLVFYAGHGWTDDRSTGYLVPVDSGSEQSPNFKASLVSMEDISNWSYQSRAKHILFVFDSCFSGAVFLTRSKHLAPSEFFVSDASREVRQFITSGSATDEVPSRSDFAPKFVEGIRGAADIYKDSVVTANELGYWLKSEITQLGKQTPQYGSATVARYRSGDVLFASGNAAATPIRYLPDAQQQALPLEVRSLGKPDNQAASGFEGIQVLYVKKNADGEKVAKALEKGRIPFVYTRPQLPSSFATNAIACGPDVPIESVKSLARLLTNEGIPIRAIMQFKNPKSKPRRIELLSIASDAQLLMSPPLSLEQIEHIETCPVLLRN